jgi:hypothetical protein
MTATAHSFGDCCEFRRLPVARRPTALGISERLACKAVGLARSTRRRLPQAPNPADSDMEMGVWLRSYATKHPCHGFPGRAWAALRYDECREVTRRSFTGCGVRRAASK